MTKSQIKGVARVRAAVRGMPGRVRVAVAREIEAGAQDVLDTMRGLVPVRTGDLAAALSAQVDGDGLRARIGLLSRTAAREQFYWQFIEFGTKGSPERNIPPMPASPFMGPALDLNAPGIAARIGRATGGVLSAGAALKTRTRK
ncbi:HK97 gp10 family phage protein [Pannonibacter tanglangensis]|uniref:HK97 gp10 family phage protein n=1 Tax=Pannonibacter tanglangensis TaxID=2750084 RepID=A0ABW9ZJM8_9HYPH|nr:HK97 gp10 family phage protein [Pannonibacter sp. XCT-34]NBN64147.1 hypothetical protein [Pannonibacter sp. XCT-34]